MENKKHEPLKLNKYHQKANKKEMAANSRMPKMSLEEFKAQGKRLEEVSRQSEMEKFNKPAEKQPADKINWDSQIQQRVFEKMGMRLRVSKPDKDENNDKK